MIRSFSLVFLIAVRLLVPHNVWAQIPTKCLEIESILVDACNPAAICPGSSEGQNEMVRFKTGPQATALAEITADWPNNNWLGLVQNATTASIVAQLNATIGSCGFLLEPPAGIIPPGSTVLMITSTDLCVQGNSFAALADTLYMVFQVAGNTNGHFANSPAAGQPISPTPPAGNTVRSLILFYLPTNCSDTASYVRELLVNNQGTFGGQSGESDGATANFSWPGVPQVAYTNFGCQAPFNPLFVQAEADGVLCGGVGTVNISAEVIGGAFTSVLWQGGTGTFGDPTALNTTYTAGPGDSGNVVLQLCVQTDCVDPVCGTLIIPAGTGPSVSIGANGPLSLCPGDDLVLTASGADSYVWGGGETTPSITVSNLGTYSVTGTNACGTGSSSVMVTAGSGINIVITGDTQICSGESTLLTASGADLYTWNTTEQTPSITVDQPGTYSVTGSNSCGTATQAITVTLAPGPTIIIAGNTNICPGQTTLLTASGADSYVWSNQATTPSITVNAAATYSVTGTNACGTGTAAATVTIAPAPLVTITGSTSFCQGQSTALTATGADSFTWSTGVDGATISVNTPGPITVTGTNACGTGTASVSLTVLLPPTVTVAGPNFLCPDQEILLTATSAAPISWNTGASGATITVTTSGSYVATVSNACGTDSDAITVTASTLDAAFMASPTSGSAPLLVSFTNTTIPANALFSWDLDDGSTSASNSPAHVFDQPGVYTVQLTATVDGCTTTVGTIITVLGTVPVNVSSIFVPNVITPNGDRRNDLLVLTATNIVSLEMLIYNRWGQKVNELKRPNEVWDARSNSGELVSEGTYFYTLTAQGADGKGYDLTGHITVLR